MLHTTVLSRSGRKWPGFNRLDSISPQEFSLLAFQFLDYTLKNHLWHLLKEQYYTGCRRKTDNIPKNYKCLCRSVKKIIQLFGCNCDTIMLDFFLSTYLGSPGFGRSPAFRLRPKCRLQPCWIFWIKVCYNCKQKFAMNTLRSVCFDVGCLI